MGIRRIILHVSAFVAGIYVTVFTDRYVVKLFPDDATKGLWVLYGLCIVVIVSALLHDKIEKWLSSSRRGLARPMTAHEVVSYLLSETKFIGYHVESALEEIRQAVVWGRIVLWAKNGKAGPIIEVPPEHLHTYRLFLAYEYFDDGGFQTEGDVEIVEADWEAKKFTDSHFVDPQFSYDDVHRVWRKRSIHITLRWIRNRLIRNAKARIGTGRSSANVRDRKA